MNKIEDYLKLDNLSELESNIAARLQQDDSHDRTVFLHGASTEVTSAFIRAAWASGWQVALLRKDSPEEHLKKIREKLGFVVECSALENGDHVVFDLASSKILSEWLQGVGLPKVSIYSWSEEESALILFTSGSTGFPKGVCHSIGNIIRSVLLFVDHFALVPENSLLCLAPIHSMSGLRSLLIPLATDIKVNMVSDVSFIELIDIINNDAPSHVLCGPIFIKMLSAYGRRIADAIVSVKAIFCTGTDIDDDARLDVQHQFSIPVLNYYGLTETSGIVLAEKPEQQYIGFLPPPCEGVGISLVADTEVRSKMYQLVIESPNIFLGYLGDTLKRKSFFNTGDLVTKTENGQLLLHGRSSGAVKAPSTEFIYPFILEKWLRSHFDSYDFSVSAINIPGGYGFRVTVDSPSSLDTSVIDRQIGDTLGQDYIPKAWDYATIRRNSLGKIVELTKHIS